MAGFALVILPSMRLKEIVELGGIATRLSLGTGNMITCTNCMDCSIQNGIVRSHQSKRTSLAEVIAWVVSEMACLLEGGIVLEAQPKCFL